MELRYPLILDGATGTQLQKRGFTGGVSAEQWVLEHPEAIIEIQKNYVEAGSNIVYASTFGANRVKLAEYGLEDQVVDYNKRLVALSKQAVGDKALVAGDIAPTGHFLEPMGDMTFDEFVDVYTQQAQALEEAGVDLFVIETSMTLPEVRAAILAVKSVSSKPVFVTFSIDEHGRSLSGTDVVAALVVAQGMGVDAFGMNCYSNLQELPDHLRRLHEVAEIPLIAKANAGLPVIEDGKTVYLLGAEDFAAATNEFMNAGAMILGGCCGTTEDHIRALASNTTEDKMVLPQNQHKDEILCATEKDFFVLPQDVSCEQFYACDENLEDSIFDAEDEDDLLMGIRISSADELENLAQSQCFIKKPVCFACEDAALLEQALRVYQGRALYEGDIPEEQLLPLVEKYGLVI